MVRLDVHQAHTGKVHMHAHPNLESSTRAVTCTMECKATHTCTRSFTYPLVSRGLYES